ncbi:uncharacterized protein LOC127509952 [Ctenopharyngodon idella]|uniref:uncharacterized protein LOC127509952 n=1 Tax=Ctenopharyngodon idella TaxID=7959 RepID=UPI0022307FFF|nr:uncharacterized protein LOC127509952 [Ctenopharyngodon idella]
MADKCDLCLLGLIVLCSLLTGTSGVNETHVFISSGENVRLPCNDALSDCNSTTWIYGTSRHSEAAELIFLGTKNKDTGRHERLSLGSDCSLNIKNVTKEDYGFYTCRQYVNKQKQGTDACVYLHVLYVSVSPSSSSQTEISPGRSVTLFCQLYSRLSCDYLVRSEGLQLLWVNQSGVDLKTDSIYQISSDRCIITLTTTLLNEDDNREWRCQLTLRNQLNTSARYTGKYSVQNDSITAVIPVHNTNSQDSSTINTHVSKVNESSELTSTAQDDSVTAVNRVHITVLTINTPETSTQDEASEHSSSAVDSTTLILVSSSNSEKKSSQTTAAASTTAPALIPDVTQNPRKQVIVIAIVAASFIVLLLALILLMFREKRADNRRGTDDSVKQTDDHVTYAEVTAYSKNQDKKNKVRCDDKVTYSSIRGAKAGSQENCSELYASVNKNHHKSVK